MNRYVENFDSSNYFYNPALDGFTIQVGLSKENLDPRYGKVNLDHVT